MKKTSFTTLFVILSFVVFGKLNYITSMEEAFKLAEEQNKFIFIKYTASFCRPCLEMEMDIENNDAFSNYFNQHFINVRIYENTTTTSRTQKINDKHKTITIAGCVNCGRLNNFKITILPTMFFMTKNGLKLTTITSYQGLDLLLKIGEDIVEHPELNININDISDTLDESSTLMIDKFLLIFKNSKIGQDIIYELIKKNRAWSDFIMKEKSHLLDFSDVLQYVRDNIGDTINYHPLVEQLLIYKLYQGGNIFNEKEFTALSSEVSATGLISYKKALAYVYCYTEIFVNPLLKKNTLEKSMVFSKALLLEFPDTKDLDLLLDAFTVVVENNADQKFYTNILNAFEDLKNNKGHYVYSDILSVVYYKIGEKEKAFRHSALAKEQSINQGYKNMEPMLRKYKSILK